MKVGDLVKFYNASWVGPVPKVYEGCGLVEEAYNDVHLKYIGLL